MKSLKASAKMILLGLCLSSTIFAQVQDSTGTLADHLYQQAKEYHDNGDADKAIEFYTRTIQTDSSHANAYFYRSRTYAARGGYPSAIADLRKVNQLEPEFGYAFGQLGRYLTLTGKFLEARQATVNALELEPGDMAWTLNLGHTYLLTRDTATAANIYQAALPLISSEEEFINGPIAGLKLFIEKGWQVAATQHFLNWFEKQYALSVKFYIESNHLFLQAQVLLQEQKYLQAAENFEKAANTEKASAQPRMMDLAATLVLAGNCYYESGKYQRAESLFQRSLLIFEEHLGPAHPDITIALNNLAALNSELGRYNEAEPLYQRSLTIREKVLDPGHPDIATSLSNLATLYVYQGRFNEAEPLFQRSLTIYKKALGSEHTNVATNLNNLAKLYRDQGRYAEAEPLYQRSLAIYEKLLGPEHQLVANALNNLATLYFEQALYNKAEPLFQRSLKIGEITLGREHPDFASSLNNLASCYESQGRYSEAEPLFQRSLTIREKILDPQHPDVATSLNNLANLYYFQGRYSEAEPLFQRSLTIREKALDPAHTEIATSLNNLANLYESQGRYKQAEQLYQRSLTILEQALGLEHLDVATNLNNIAGLYHTQGRYREAEPLFLRSLAIRENVLGQEHPDVATSLNTLAMHYFFLRDYPRGTQIIEQAIQISSRIILNPQYVANIFYWSARLKKQLAEPALAIEHLARSLAAAESIRPQISGGEEVQAIFFQKYTPRFDLMIRWQIEAGNLRQAFEYLERNRARTLLDQLGAGKIDLWEGIEDPQIRATLQNKERNALTRKAEFQQRITLLRSRKDLTEEEKQQLSDTLNAQLRLAEKDFQNVYNDIKNASWLMREVITSGGELASLPTVQSRLLSAGRYMLSYQIGEEESHLFLIPPAGQSLRYYPLSVSAEAANTFGIETGALTNEKMNRVLLQQDGTAEQGSILNLLGSNNRGGITPMNNKASDSLTIRLAALREILIPDSLWPKLQALEEVIIIPDAALNLLPFEALVITPGETPPKTRYWLDEGPPIRYAASATVLYNITQRPAARLLPDVTQPKVLSLSDPIFDFSLVQQTVSGDSGDREQTSSRKGDDADRKNDAIESIDALLANVNRNEYERIGGPLTELPGTARESDSLKSVFTTDGNYPELKVLQRRNATEAQLRQHLPGKRYIHIGTHGLVDQQRNSAFASLALTPSITDTVNPENDGFLELHEIYGLKLPDCELAVLSACETNVGRYVEGEGVFALTRGFLAAGARRVIASQWPVNDAASAEIIGAFFQTIAGDEKAGIPVNYSKALHEAKRKVRQQEKWADPFYWAPFVITGKR